MTHLYAAGGHDGAGVTLNKRVIPVKIRRFREGATLPTKGTALAAGYDISAWIDPTGEPDTINPGECLIVKTGLNFRLAPGYQAEIRSRSGLAAKKQVFVLNSPGTIDEDFNGDGPDFELKVILFNAGKHPFLINHGDRVAQMVIEEVIPTEIIEVFEENTDRGGDRLGGLGTTGVSLSLDKPMVRYGEKEVPLPKAQPMPYQALGTKLLYIDEAVALALPSDASPRYERETDPAKLARYYANAKTEDDTTEPFSRP